LCGEIQISCDRCKVDIAALAEVAGLVYVLTNPGMPGLVKIGFTTRTMEERLAELSAATGVPKAFVVEAVFEHSSPASLERAAHRALSEKRFSSDREFFDCSTEEAIAVVQGEAKRSPIFARVRARCTLPARPTKAGRTRHSLEKADVLLTCVECGHLSRLSVLPYETHGRCQACKLLQSLP
jgi:hypothetical protein